MRSSQFTTTNKHSGSGMQRRRRRRRKKPAILPILLLILVILSVPYAAITQFKVITAEKEHNNLLSSIDKIEKDSQEIANKNKDLQDTIKQREADYKSKMENAKIAYLTFDDGPSGHTDQILDILDKYNVKATFFVNGHPGLEDMYKDISNRGHVIANHTFSHEYDDVYNSVDAFKSEVEKLNNFVKNIIGEEPSRILRYPGGSSNTVSYNSGGPGIMKEIIKEMAKEGYEYFDWNVDSTDALVFRQDKDVIVNNVLTQSEGMPKINVLMHDTPAKTTTVEALPEIIEGLKKQGFIFASLSQDSFKPQFLTVEY